MTHLSLLLATAVFASYVATSVNGAKSCSKACTTPGISNNVISYTLISQNSLRWMCSYDDSGSNVFLTYVGLGERDVYVNRISTSSMPAVAVPFSSFLTYPGYYRFQLLTDASCEQVVTVNYTDTGIDIDAVIAKEVTGYNESVTAALESDNATKVYSAFNNASLLLSASNASTEVVADFTYSTVNSILSNANTVPSSANDIASLTSALSAIPFTYVESNGYTDEMYDICTSLVEYSAKYNSTLTLESMSNLVTYLQNYLKDEDKADDVFNSIVETLISGTFPYNKTIDVKYESDGLSAISLQRNKSQLTTKLSVNDVTFVPSADFATLLENTGSVSYSVVSYANPVMTANLTAEDKVTNPVEIAVYSYGTKQSIVNLTTPVEFSMPVNKSEYAFEVPEGYYSNGTSMECVWWNNNAWSSEGCSLASYNDGVVTCQCTHLTLFAVHFRDTLIPQTLNIAELFTRTSDYAVLGATIGILVGIWIIGAIATFAYDSFRPKAQRVSPLLKTRLYDVVLYAGSEDITGIYELHLNGANMQEVIDLDLAIIHNTSRSILVRGLDVGVIQSISLLLSNRKGSSTSRSSSSSILSATQMFHMITITDIKRQQLLTFNPLLETLALENYTYPPITKPVIPAVCQDIMMSYTRRLYLEVYLRMFDRHLWLSIMCRPRMCAYTSLDRFLLGFMWVTITAVCGLAWFTTYESSSAVHIAQKIVVAIIASAISFAAITPLEYILRHAAVSRRGDGIRYKYRVLAYIVIVIVTLGCIAVCCLYAVNLDKYGLLLQWFESFLFSVFETLAISQPILVLILAAVAIHRRSVRRAGKRAPLNNAASFCEEGGSPMLQKSAKFEKTDSATKLLGDRVRVLSTSQLLDGEEGDHSRSNSSSMESTPIGNRFSQLSAVSE